MKFIYLKKIQTFIQGVNLRKKNVLLITDKNIFSIYKCFLKELNYPVLVIPPGEKIKSRKGKSFIEDYLFSHKYCQNTELIAFGGGVISDLVGFVAKTYMRGISFSIIPTTIIGLVDASIGGKNGINTKFGKNFIGSFYNPIQVCSEEIFLTTLEKKLYKEQCSEIIKIALTSDRDLFFSMKDSIQRAINLKKNIVKIDKNDCSLRKILNFGHTFAHAYEAYSNYTISHGKAVWKGIYFASLLSYKNNILPKEEWEIIKAKIIENISQWKFPNFDEETIYNLMVMDKKSKDHTPYFVLINAIGSVYKDGDNYTHKVSKKLVLETLSIIKKEAICAVR